MSAHGVEVGLLILRVVTGLVWCGHGAQKLSAGSAPAGVGRSRRVHATRLPPAAALRLPRRHDRAAAGLRSRPGSDPGRGGPDACVSVQAIVVASGPRPGSGRRLRYLSCSPRSGQLRVLGAGGSRSTPRSGPASRASPRASSPRRGARDAADASAPGRSRLERVSQRRDRRRGRRARARAEVAHPQEAGISPSWRVSSACTPASRSRAA